jgi:hypothetical protein
MIRDFERPVETDARWTNHLDSPGAGAQASRRPAWKPMRGGPITSTELDQDGTMRIIKVETDARWTNHLDLEGALERVEMSEWKPMRGGPITSTRCSAREGRYFFQVETDARWTNHLDSVQRYVARRPSTSGNRCEVDQSPRLTLGGLADYESCGGNRCEVDQSPRRRKYQGGGAGRRRVETDARWTNHLDLPARRARADEWKPMRGGPITSTLSRSRVNGPRVAEPLATSLYSSHRSSSAARIFGVISSNGSSSSTIAAHR